MSGKYKNTIIASIGSGAEYYDFIVYALMSPYLSQVFFHGADHVHNVFYYFSIFAVGYFFRPIGGVLLGYLSDRCGRKKAFILATSGMCVATFVIGFLPVSYMNNTVIVIVLLVCRILQGLSFGGQLSNAVTFIYENSNNKYLHGSFVFTSVGFGSLLALFVVHMLSNYVSYQEVLEFWWRLPFIFGGTLMLLCFVCRGHLEEGNQQAHSNISLFGVLKRVLMHKNEVILCVLISTAIASLIIVNLFFPTYFSVFYSYEVSQIYSFMMYSMMFSVVLSPLFGMFFGKRSDKVWFFVHGIAVFLCVLIFFMFFLEEGSPVSVLVFMSVIQIFIGYFFVLSLPFMSSLFDKSIRNTAVAFCYNVGYLGASIIPSTVTYFKSFLQEFGIFYIVGGIYFALALFIILMFKVKKKLHYDRSKNYS